MSSVRLSMWDVENGRCFLQGDHIQAENLEVSAFDSYNAIHLASTEQTKVDVFLTTDDNIQKVSNRKKEAFSFAKASPARWLKEVLK